MNASKTKRRAFTLIELLVVVAIIVVLIAILIPSLARAKESARQVTCATKLRQWGIAAHAYSTENGGALPSKGGDGCKTPLPGQNAADASVGNWDDMSLWFNAIPSEMRSGTEEIGYGGLQEQLRPQKYAGLPQYGVNSIFICPSALTDPQGVTSGAQPSGNSNADVMWSNGSASAGGSFFMVYGSNSTTNPNPGSDGRPFLICYQWNSKLVTGAPGTTIYTVDTTVVNTVCPRVTDVGAGSQNVVLMSEKRIRQDEIPLTDPENPSCQIDPSTFNFHYYPLCQPKGAWHRFTTRHFDGGNVLFIDDRVEYFKYHDVVTPSKLPAGGNTNSGDWNQPATLVWNPFYPAN